MTPRISLFIAALHALLYLGLALRVVLRRRASRIGVGSGGDEVLSRRVRVHANFGEYVPLALLLLALLELCGSSPVLVWSCGLLLLAARLLHAIGLGGSAGYSFGRFAGTLLTFLVLLAMALAGLWQMVALQLV
ncbi:MAPEG family protein [Luteimonas sp. SDU101]|uniref:MAPEG family protein n=1 Tax=unclassified Luteimonas TaxID=2629088 RepID=UPI003EC12D9D